MKVDCFNPSTFNCSTIQYYVQSQKIHRRLPCLAEVSAALPNLAKYAAQTPAGKDYIVRDFSLAEWGRKEIAVAEHEMPGLMSVRKKYAKQSRSKACASPVRCT